MNKLSRFPLSTIPLFPFLFLLILTLFSACSDDDEMMVIPMEPEGNQSIDIGDYSINQSSLESIPYLDKSQIVFIDSTDKETIFEIEESDLLLNSGATFFKYNVFEEGDTVEYPYTSQVKRLVLSSDSLNLRLDLSLTARPYYPDPESRNVADIMNIFCGVPDTTFSSVQVFYHETDQRTYPSTWNPEVLDEITFHGRTFTDVFNNDFIDAKLQVYWNYEFGIVAFTDLTDNLWRFKDLE